MLLKYSPASWIARNRRWRVAELQEPPEAIKMKLRNFARGELPPAEQAGLLDQLNQNRHWLSLLAEEVKALRPRNQSGRKNS